MTNALIAAVPLAVLAGVVITAVRNNAIRKGGIETDAAAERVFSPCVCGLRRKTSPIFYHMEE